MSMMKYIQFMCRLDKVLAAQTTLSPDMKKAILLEMWKFVEPADPRAVLKEFGCHLTDEEWEIFAVSLKSPRKEKGGM